MEHIQNSSKRDIMRNTCLSKGKKSQINLILHIKRLEKEQLLSKITRRKEMINIREKISEMETKNNRKYQ